MASFVGWCFYCTPSEKNCNGQFSVFGELRMENFLGGRGGRGGDTDAPKIRAPMLRVYCFFRRGLYNGAKTEG